MAGNGGARSRSAQRSPARHRPRCQGIARYFQDPAGEPDSLVANPSAIWHENRKVPDLLYPGRVHNGFVLLNLNGPALTETFINEDGVKVYMQSFPAQ
jgi:hypothetical protein